MKYFALFDDEGSLITFGTTTALTTVGEITLEEYEVLKAAHIATTSFAEQVFNGETTLEDVPEEYQEAVAEMVEQMQAQPEESASDIDEAIAILTGEVSES